MKAAVRWWLRLGRFHSSRGKYPLPPNGTPFRGHRPHLETRYTNTGPSGLSTLWRSVKLIPLTNSEWDYNVLCLWLVHTSTNMRLQPRMQNPLDRESDRRQVQPRFDQGLIKVRSRFDQGSTKVRSGFDQGSIKVRPACVGHAVTLDCIKLKLVSTSFCAFQIYKLKFKFLVGSSLQVF